MQEWMIRRRRAEGGTSAVEFSIIAPVFLLLVFLIIQIGLWYFGRNVAEAAAREGVSYLRLAGNDSDPATFEPQAAKIASYYASQVGMLHNVKVTPTINVSTGRATVLVSGTLHLPGGDIRVEQSAEATLEQFRGDPRGDE